MSYALADEAVSVLINFRNAGQPVIPTTNSVSYVVRDNSGVVISGIGTVQVATGPADTSITIVIPSEYTSAPNGLEKRTVQVTWSLNGNPRKEFHTVWLHPYLNISATPDHVRSFIGLNATELPDEEIDIVGAYYRLANDLSLATVEAATAETGPTAQYIDQAIVATAVLEVLPSVQLRVAQKMSDGAVGFDRLSKIDFSEIKKKAIDRLEKAKEALSLEDEVTPTLVSFGTRTDAITGV